MTDLAGGTRAEPQGGPRPHAPDDLERYRTELTGYCYRMLGSGFEADDAVQETMVRAWKALDRFEGRSSLRSWLYRIATNVCLDMHDSPQRRARPMDLGPSGTLETGLGPVLPENTWIQPVPDGKVVPEGDPSEVAAARESIQLAFLTAVQELPPRQRAALVLCEVLRWRADEAAELLDTSVAAVNSALQRARATLADRRETLSDRARPVTAEDQDLLDRYVDAFERYDMAALTALLHDDAHLCMPPYALWIEGPEEMARWMLGPGHGCQGSRMVATAANGTAAFAQYRPDPEGGHAPWALQVLEVADGKVASICSFLEVDRLFGYFDLPDHLPAEP